MVLQVCTLVLVFKNTGFSAFSDFECLNFEGQRVQKTTIEGSLHNLLQGEIKPLPRFLFKFCTIFNTYRIQTKIHFANFTLVNSSVFVGASVSHIILSTNHLPVDHFTTILIIA